MSAMTVTIDREIQVFDRSFESAARSERRTVLPGTYPVRFTTERGFDVRPGATAYYFDAQIQVRIDEERYDGNVFNAHTTTVSHPNEVRTRIERDYAYNIERGLTIGSSDGQLHTFPIDCGRGVSAERLADSFMAIRGLKVYGTREQPIEGDDLVMIPRTAPWSIWTRPGVRAR